MNKNDKLSASIQRNAGSMIIDGYHLFFKNLGTIIRRTWILAICYALSVGFSCYYYFIHIMPKLHTDAITFKELATFIGAAIVYLIFAILIIATILKMLTEHRNNDFVFRGKWYGELNVKTIPLAFKVFWRILKHVWRYFAVVLVVSIITIIVSCFMEGSAIYLSIAHMKAQESMAIGDPYQMPEHIGLITFGVFTFCAFIQAYLHASSLFPLYYAYCSFEKEKPHQDKGQTEVSK